MNDIFRGVIRPLNEEAGLFNFTLEIKLSKDEGINKNTLDSTIHETVQQLGAKITREEKQ